MLQWLLVFVGLSAAGTWLARRYALHRRLIDEPGERRSHSVATPRGGGIGIVLSVLVACVAVALRFPPQAPALVLFAAGFALVALVGWVDDHRPLSPWSRLAVHAAAAALLAVAAALQPGAAPWLPVATALGALVLVNAWNFMDGIDGLAGSQAALAALALSMLASPSWAWLGLAVVAATSGFLPFNLPRARIFMGDVGSGAVGYALAGVAMAALSTRADNGWLVLLPFSAFLIDTGLTLARRVWRRERWWSAHTQHAYQVAARRFGHLPVTVGFAAWTVTWSFVALLARGDERFMIGNALACYTSAAFIWSRLQRLEQPKATDAS